MSISEDTFTSWSKVPGTTEQERCDNAERAVRKAIDASEALSAMDITVFPQGSYAGRTNVRQNSDVDICVRLNSVAFSDYPDGKGNSDYGRVESDLKFADYRNMVGKALTDYFGAKSVTRGIKAFDVHENSYRIDADVIATFEHRRYLSDGTNRWHAGVAFKTDAGDLIKNFPKQCYDSGVAKNDRVGRRYKRVVRILKRLRDAMQDQGITAAKNVPSFLIECLVWNVPDDRFNHDSYAADVRAVLAHTFNATLNDNDCSSWVETNELKWLFKGAKPWTRVQAHDFLGAAWNQCGFK